GFINRRKQLTGEPGFAWPVRRGGSGESRRLAKGRDFLAEAPAIGSRRGCPTRPNGPPSLAPRSPRQHQPILPDVTIPVATTWFGSIGGSLNQVATPVALFIETESQSTLTSNFGLSSGGG